MGSQETFRIDHAAALALLRRLRHQGIDIGIRNSGIAFDIALTMYEAALADPPQPMSVDIICDSLGYSGPTVRLVLKRLTEAGSVAAAERQGKTQFYALTPRGRQGFDGYIAALVEYRCAKASAAASPAIAPDRPADPAPLPARCAAAPPATAGQG